jgi:hypothetical protein
MRGVLFLLGVVATLAGATLLAGCDDKPGSQTSLPSPTSTEPQAEVEYDLQATGYAAAQQLGGHAAAAYAVLKAADNGYSPYQTAAAIQDGLLDESGVIQGVTPTAPPGDVLSEAPLDTRVAAASFASLKGVFAEADEAPSTRSDLEEVFAQVGDEGAADRWLLWVLGATGAGYSAGQITQYLGERGPPTQVTAPTIADVPVLHDANGDWVAPELGADWPYLGRNILRGLQRDTELDFDDKFTILVVAMVNAGYTKEQINDALWTNSIALCTTPDGTAFTVGYLDPDGQLIPPEAASPGSHTPGTIVIADMIGSWPTATAGTGASGSSDDTVARFGSGETVTLKLTPYLVQKDSGMAITSHDVVMTLRPSDSSVDPAYASAHITCRWTIEIVQETDTGSWAPGTKFVIQGEAWDEDDMPQPLRAWQKMDYSTSWTVFKPDGQEDYRDSETGKGFAGYLDEELQGWGGLPGGPAQVNWDTYPVDE